MKRLIGLAVCLGLALALSGCGGTDESGSKGKSSSSPSPSGGPPSGPRGGPSGGPRGGPPGPSSRGPAPSLDSGDAPGAAQADAKPEPKPFDDHSDDPWYAEEAAAKPGAPAKSGGLAAVGKTVVGVWKGKPTPQEDKKKSDPMADMFMTIEFKDGGAMSVNTPFFTLNGTWEVLAAEGNNVSIKTVMEMPDLPFGMEKGKEKAGVTANKDTKDLLIVFLTDDRITMAPKDDPKDVVTFERQKK